MYGVVIEDTCWLASVYGGALLNKPSLQFVFDVEVKTCLINKEKKKLP